MRKSKYSEYQIIDVLRRAEAGVPVRELRRLLRCQVCGRQTSSIEIRHVAAGGSSADRNRVPLTEQFLRPMLLG